jgi:proteasome assembly chaperone (PAC2) family protein
MGWRSCLVQANHHLRRFARCQCATGEIYNDGMIEPIEWLSEPELNSPMLLCAFGGWGDASDAATGAVRWLISHWDGQKIARIRPDDFFDFTVARPSVRLEEGGQRAVVWPTVDVYAVGSEGMRRELVLIYGREPHLQWPQFATAVLEIARRCSAVRCMTLGAFFGPVLHRSPVSLTGYASEPELIQRLNDAGAVPSTYEGPTGIASVLHDTFRAAGIPSISLWAAVPFYLGSLRPNPRATHALLEGLSRTVDLDIELSRLRQAADYFDEQIERQVEESKELQELITRLTSQLGEPSSRSDLPESAPERGGELPSADSIIRDLEDFLRGRRTEGGSEQASG